MQQPLIYFLKAPLWHFDKLYSSKRSRIALREQTGASSNSRTWRTSLHPYWAISSSAWILLPPRSASWSNQKPWMTGEVRTLLKERNEAFRCGDGAQYSAARASLKRGIREAKTAYQRRTEEHLSSSNTRQVWQEVQHITGYKSNNLSEGESRLPPLSIHQHQHRLPPRAVLWAPYSTPSTLMTTPLPTPATPLLNVQATPQ